MAPGRLSWRGPINVGGQVHAAFTDVAEQFRRLFRRGGGGGALAVSLRGELVVDLWAGTRDLANELPWEHDTMALSFSTTKGVTSTVIHRLADRGLIDLSAPVADHWPAFAAGGKSEITVADLLTHRAGLHDVGRLLDTPADVLDHQLLEKRLAAATPTVRPRSRSGYHGFTFGWLMSGLARAVTGKDMRDLFRDEVAAPLGLDGLRLGIDPTDDATLSRAATLLPTGLSLVELLGGPVGQLPGVRRVREALYVDGFDVMLTEPPVPVVGSQMPAVNGFFTARDLAILYATLAAGGRLDGVELLRPAALARATARMGGGRDYVLGIPMGWRLGFHQPMVAGRSPQRAFGHYGYGGSGAWADPDLQLAVAFVTNRIGSGTTPVADSRLLRLNGRILDAVARV